jgi:hypothetical protein
MTAPQRTPLRSRWCLAGVLVAFHVCFGPSLKAAVVVETFTDYNAFLSLLGSQAQVITFDDVPTIPDPILEPDILLYYGYLDPNRYADQGIVIHGQPSQMVLRSSDAVSSPNVYQADLGVGPDPASVPGAFRETTFVSFTRNGQPALTSAFGTFFIGNTPIDELPGADFSSVGGYPAGFTSPEGSTFLGLATVDSATGQLVPSIGEIDIRAGSHGTGPEPDLDNFTFASPVSPVPEGNVWALLAAAALAAVGLARRRAAAP